MWSRFIKAAKNRSGRGWWASAVDLRVSREGYIFSVLSVCVETVGFLSPPSGLPTSSLVSQHQRVFGEKGEALMGG